MRLRLLLFCALLSIVPLGIAWASLSPEDVVVVYNSNPAWNDDAGRNISKAVADYYCDKRGIPSTNKIGLYIPPLPGVNPEQLTPLWFATYLLSDQYDEQGILLHKGLKTQLAERPGFDANDPGSDPTKCIVLCYGIPLGIQGGERTGSVDSTLTMLFHDDPGATSLLEATKATVV